MLIFVIDWCVEGDWFASDRETPRQMREDTPMRKPTRQQLIRYFVNHQDQTIRFIANVILTGGSFVTDRLRGGLYLLEQGGHEIRMTQFSMDYLMVDGRTESLSSLPDLHLRYCPRCGDKTAIVASTGVCQSCSDSAYDRYCPR
jgi:hypothetical protein